MVSERLGPDGACMVSCVLEGTDGVGACMFSCVLEGTDGVGSMSR